jgi:predicted AlkP superfamily phosphohydrolase/phosphomutase
MKPRTLLLGLDGATFTILDPLMAAGEMPFFKELVASGVRAELRSVVPALTPPAWTSLATGRSPGWHGIFDFFGKDAPDDKQIRVADSRDVRVPTLWSILDGQGMSSTALNFPMMFPPPQVNGFVVPGWMPWRQLRLGCHPKGLFDRLKGLPGLDTRKLAMDMETEAKAIEGGKPEEYEEWIRLHLERERQWHIVLRELMANDPSELTAVIFDGPDKIQHLCWRFLDPEYAGSLEGDWAASVRESCLDYFRELDRLLADLVELAGAVASDHGFGAQRGTFFVNAWLEQQGYLAWSGDAAPRAEDATELGLGQLARHSYQLDWSKTRAFCATPSSNGIFIANVPDDEYESFRDKLAQELAGVTDTASGEAIVSRVWKRDEVFDGPQGEMAPDLTLELNDGGLVSILASDTAYERRVEVSGTHRPEGVFVARGPQLKRGVAIPELSILDIAPLVLHSLGLAIPDDMEGRVPAAALDAEALERQPVRSGPAEPPAPSPAPAPGGGYGEEDEQVLVERLRALGYIN